MPRVLRATLWGSAKKSLRRLYGAKSLLAGASLDARHFRSRPGKSRRRMYGLKSLLTSSILDAWGFRSRAGKSLRRMYCAKSGWQRVRLDARRRIPSTDSIPLVPRTTFWSRVGESLRRLYGTKGPQTSSRLDARRFRDRAGKAPPRHVWRKGALNRRSRQGPPGRR